MKIGFLMLFGCFALLSFKTQVPASSYSKLVSGVYKGIYKSNSLPHSVLDYNVEVLPINDSVVEIKTLSRNQSRSFNVILYVAENQFDTLGNPIRLEIKSPTANFDRKGYFYPASGILHYTYNGINSDPANFEIFTGEKD